MENQLDSVIEKPICFLRLQGLACDWSKHNKHSRNIFSVHGFLRLSVTEESLSKLQKSNTRRNRKSIAGNHSIASYIFLSVSVDLSRRLPR